LPTLERATAELGGMLVAAVTTTGCSVHQSVVLVTEGATYEHVATHGRGIQLGEEGSPVIPTPVGWLGLMCGEEGFVPEVARDMLQHADVIAWSAFQARPMLEVLVRTRADENRLFVAAAWQGGGVVSAPTGAPLAVSPCDSGIAMTATVNPVLAQFKEMAPGTDVVKDRVPEAYGALVR
jgi:predicted amidohydrolase